MLSASDMRYVELMLFYGSETHKVHVMLQNVRSNLSLSNQMYLIFNGVASSIKSVLSAMIVGELVHWAIEVRSVVDFKV